jgi:hypothetical protein
MVSPMIHLDIAHEWHADLLRAAEQQRLAAGAANGARASRPGGVSGVSLRGHRRQLVAVAFDRAAAFTGRPATGARPCRSRGACRAVPSCP